MSEFTSTLPFQKQAELWGHAYEILVKRGVLACLIENQLLSQSHPALQPWRESRLTRVSSNLAKHLDVIDENARDLIRAAVDHLALTAFGVGYTAMREYIKPLRRPAANGKLAIRAIWCPLTLPGESSAEPEAREAARLQFHAELEFPGVVDPALSGKGQPANADFMVWFSGTKEDHLLVQEYSFDMPGEMGDFRDQQAHLDELLRHRRIVDSRSVFARVAAEVDGESFDVSDDIRRHLTALTSDNKPFYKLCQAAAYAESTTRLLNEAGLIQKPAMVRALAITPNGLESLAARFDDPKEKEPRRKLMEQMGEAYRLAAKLPDGSDEALTQKVEAVFSAILRRLPAALQKGMKGLRQMPMPGQDFSFQFEEVVPSFANPMDEFSVEQALAYIEETPSLTEYFRGSAKGAIEDKIRALASRAGKLSLRDMHACAIVAGMEQAKAGALNVIALEGNPGIGKTTAVRKFLAEESDGFLFLYVSPRVVINRDVTESLGRTEGGEPTGILTITSNAQLNAAARRFYKDKVDRGLAEPRLVEGAVVADGIRRLVTPSASTILVLTPEEEATIDTHFAGESYRKTTLSESEDQVVDARRMGVLSGVSHTTRDLLRLNPEVNRVVITVALQGFRERSDKKTTMDALSKLFENKALTKAGVAERRAFSQRLPNIVVMVDELTGDGAGAPFVHAVANWLHQEFFEPFEDEPSPFTASLIVSDASLGNEIVLDRYLNAGDRTPDKVLISRSRGEQPFAVAATTIRIGGRLRPTYHVMTNSFPARKLTVRYQARLTNVNIEETRTGLPETPRQAIRRASEEAVMASAVREISNALDNGALQVIYFAQDKNFLGDLQAKLANDHGRGLSYDVVKILDSSVPGWQRANLVKPQTRDSVRVFLMTSSGARGVSFPKTDWIIASMPRFNVEASLMEIAQLIYRGRGKYKDDDGNDVVGDFSERRLVMLTEDFVVREERLDKRQWLRQSMDLMTLLVMLRATLYTRITGAAGLKQKLALVPVGAVGVEELVSVMSQNVMKFMSEAEAFQRRNSDNPRVGLLKNAQSNVNNLFSRTRLQASNPRDKDGRTMVKLRDMQRLRQIAASGVSPILVEQSDGTSLPEHVYFAGPVVMESWRDFDKQEIFTFEGHETQIAQCSEELLGQLYRIDKDKNFPSALRVPALNLYRLISREKEEAANEFSTLKDLKSPNTWVALPTGYAQFVYNEDLADGRPFITCDPELWRDGLAKSLGATASVMPPIPHYELFPWAASVGQVNPLKLDLVFDDRYFMASNELNLLNTLLLEAAATDASND